MGKPNDLTLRVEAALEEIRPFLASDGGGISLIEITDDKVGKSEVARILCRLLGEPNDPEEWDRNDR